MKKTFVAIVIAIIYLPLVLGIVSANTKYNCDVTLDGYTDNVEKPQFKPETFFTGEFQSNYSAWFEQNLKLRGVFTRTYSSIRFNLFYLGNRPVGYNHDVFEWNYINSELGINGAENLNNQQNQELLDDYVDKLVSVNEKLQKCGKTLYLFVTPSKANFNKTNISKKYKDISPDDMVTPVEYLAEKIAKTDVPYLICRDMKDSLEYPAFYTTGIHWSRTFEQKASAQVISDLAALTGKNYRNIVLGNANQSSEPYWRDDDVYKLLNVWNKINNIDYYEYTEEREYSEEYDKIRLLIQGTSFSEGIRRDISMVYPYEDVYYINRAKYITDLTEKQIKIESWDTFDITNYLNNVDAIVIETTEAEIMYRANGFLEYLNSFLDTYEPMPYVADYPRSFDTSSDEPWQLGAVKGVYGPEDWFAWTTPYFQVTVRNEEITEDGLEIEFMVPGLLFEDDSDYIHMEVFVNGKKLHESDYSKKWRGSVYIDEEELEADGDVYCVEIYCSKYFNPKERGMSEDNRNLSLQLMYMGKTREGDKEHEVLEPENGNYAKCFDGNSDEAWKTDSLIGVFDRENEFAWCEPDAHVIIESTDILEKGLELEIQVPYLLFLNDKNSVHVTVFVNGKRLSEKNYTIEGIDTIIIDKEELKEFEKIFDVEIKCSKYYNPKENGMSPDDRNLALQLRYIGGVR